MTIEQLCRAMNQKGLPMVRPDEDEPQDRVEDVTELSDLEYHGQHERFTQ